VVVEGSKSGDDSEQEARHAKKLRQAIERVLFKRGKSHGQRNEENEKSPEDELDVGLSWEVGAGEGNLVEADQTQFSERAANK
jgi:hypothetical protein